jgi:hypothetical protein
MDDAAELSGKTLEIDGNSMQIGEAHSRFLAMTSTLYCRHLVCNAEESEDDFLQSALEILRNLDLRFKKVLCGKGASFASPEGPITTRSLMVAGLTLDDAMTLQEEGIGPLRSRGFGLFVPHKTV